ncbi:serine/threonine-protein kinase phg2 [Teleopsis dalmanni]|uniref:serine/threonine-protein kinase phg2 n=1 Tax=Teleopsis dalmanni TaxID=139649 RepID=UPI0018CD180E|nr:serine/threonine-protein kinase phg2 [Teleopsis dalmanni]
MAKMGKLTPEEEARAKMLLRERDRERKRIKRMDPEYRKLEQERDRDRKKQRRSNEAFRQMEKLRDKIRKERKKGIIVTDETMQTAAAEFAAAVPQVSVEPEIVIADPLPLQDNNHNRTTATTTASNCTSTNIISQANNTNNGPSNVTNTNTSNNCNISTAVIIASSTATTTVTNVAPATIVNTITPPHMPQLNKGLLYPPPTFPHHPLPIAGVTLMPQLCHPILHQNLSATLYPPNGIKQEIFSNHDTSTSSATITTIAGSTGHQLPGSGNGNSKNIGTNNSGSATGASSNEEHEIPLIEPEIILQTDFHNHAHAAHHIHQQQCSMFQHMTAPHMLEHTAHMRAHAALSQPLTPQQQQQQMPHYAAKIS